MQNREAELASEFEKLYQHSPQAICHAPGRVNLIGDHTDYNQGFVLPAAINFGTDIAASKRDDNMVVVVAADFEFQKVEFSIDDIFPSNQNCWSDYVKGTIKELLKYYDIHCGVNLLVSGNVPQGAGLSSSASLEVAILKTFSVLFGLNLEGVKAAVMAQTAENEFVGCQCGIMDQLISAMGEKEHALLIDCENLQLKKIKVPKELSLLIINSNVPRGLVDSEYNSRRKQCEQVAISLDVLSLRHLKLTDLQKNKSKLDEEQFIRARHVLSESDRVIELFDAFSEGDLSKISRLMYQSHESLKNDFEVSCEQTDFIVEVARELVGDKGGARMTGGGFGGCVVCLIPQEMIDLVKQEVEAQYYRRFSLAPDFYLCSIEGGSFIH